MLRTWNLEHGRQQQLLQGCSQFRGKQFSCLQSIEIVIIHIFRCESISTLLIIFAWFWWHSTLDSQNYYIAIWVKRQVWFGNTVQISLVCESSVLCHQNHAKIFSSEDRIVLLTLKAWSFSHIIGNQAVNIDIAAGWCTSAIGPRD